MSSRLFLKLMYLISIRFSAIIASETNMDQNCNRTEIKLADLLNNVLDIKTLPGDLLELAKKFQNTNDAIFLKNCSSVLTLPDQIVKNSLDADLQQLFYKTLSSYLDFQYFIPKNTADIIKLTNSFLSANISLVLFEKMQNYFFMYENFLQVLKTDNFLFENYSDPRILLLDIICELVKINDGFRTYEREAILFLLANRHVCNFLTNLNTNSTITHENSTKGFHLSLFSNTRVVDNNHSLEKTNLNNANIFINKPFRYLPEKNNKRLFLNISVITHIKLGTLKSVGQTGTGSNIEIRENINFGSTPEQNLTITDVVEMDGPCKEGQQYYVKLNIASVLTALDKQVSNSSLELLKNELINATSFPIEDYNARGQLLRDLIIAVMNATHHSETTKHLLEEILDHVLLDGLGALPPKLKLECLDVPQTGKHNKRTIRRIFTFK